MGETIHVPPTLYLGRSAALESALTDWVGRAQAGDALRRVTVVVGSRAARDRASWLVATRLGAVANVRIVTLRRLADDMRSQGQQALPQPLSRLARQRLVARLVAERAGDPDWYFAPIAAAPGTPSAFLRTFDDLREACVAPGEVPTSPRRLGDVAALYGRYVAELDARGLVDDAAGYAAAARAAAPPAPPFGPVALFGFYDLPEMQARFVASLATGGDLSAFTPLMPGSEAYVEPLCRLFTDCGLVAVGLHDEAGERRALDRARRRLFGAREPLEAPAADESLSVASAPDEVGEVRCVVAELLGGAARGVLFHEMAVITPDPATRRRVAGALLAQGVPVAASLPDEPPVSRACGLALDALAPEAGPALARDAVAALAAVVRRPDLATRWDEISRRCWVVAGAEQWRERIGDATGGTARSDEARRGLLAFVEVLESGRRRLQAQSTWDGLADAALATLSDLSAGDDSGAAVGRLATEPVTGVLRDLADLSRVEANVDTSTFATALRRELSALESPPSPLARVGRNGVAIVSPEQARGVVFRVAVLCDMAEGGFPARAVPDPMLSDEERRAIGSRSAVALRATADRDRESELLFALALDAVAERVVLVTPRIDATSGRPRLPSRLLLEACGAWVGRAVMFRELEDDGALGGLVHRVRAGMGTSGEDADDALDGRDRDIRVLAERPHADPACVGEVFGPSATRREQAVRAPTVARLTPWDARLTSAHGRQIRAALLSTPVSPTAIQSYLDCPFVYFVRYGLRLLVPDEPSDELTIDAGEFGTVAHRVLKESYEVGGGRQAVLDRLAATAPAIFAAAERRGVTGHRLVWEVTRDRLLEDLTLAVRQDDSWERGYVPDRLEWDFGDDPLREVSFDVGDVRLRFKGRVDRIDRADGDLRLIDYKTGRGSAENDRVKNGREVQLAVYVEAARQALAPDGSVTAAYRLVTRKGGFADIPVDDDGGERLRAVVADVLAGMAAGVFAATSIGSPRSRCGFCDLTGLCGADKTAVSRKTGGVRGGDPRAPEAPE